MKTLTQLDKWNKDIEQLTDMAENASSAKLFKYYRGALIDIKKQMKAYIDNYDSLSFAKRLEADRLISVGAQIDKTLKETYGNAKGEIVDHSTISAENGYYGTWYALEGNDNVQLDMAFLDKKYIHQLIYKEVAGATFSARLYKERDKLAAATKQALLDATRDGKGYGHAAKAVEEATEASYKQALRIMRTEGGRARSEATQKSYVNAEKNGITLEKQWIATLDKKTRRAHGELDGQRVPVKGKFKMDGHSADGPRLFKFPALDINCRCSTISVVNGIAPEVRRTKDSVVPFQSYNEWAKSKGVKLNPAKKIDKQFSKDYKYFGIGDEKNSFLSKQRDKRWASLSDEEKTMLSKYTQGVAGDWNGKTQSKYFETDFFKRSNSDKWLKDNTGYTVDEYRAMMKRIANTPIGDNVRLFRGVNESEFNWIKGSNQWRAATSTATNDYQNDFFSKKKSDWDDTYTVLGYRVNMYVTPETKGIFIGDKTSYSEDQFEYILRPDSKYRLLPSDDDHVINIQVFPDDATDDYINGYPAPNLGANQMEKTATQLANEATKKAAEKARLESGNAKSAVKKESQYAVGKTLTTKKNGVGKVVDISVEDPAWRGEDYKVFVKIQFENGKQQRLPLKDVKDRLK